MKAYPLDTFPCRIQQIQKLIANEKFFSDEINLLNELSGRTAGSELILSVFGQFKRGKSSFINRLLGVELLPVGIIPVTAVVTCMMYGETPKVTLKFETGDLKVITPIELENYVDERANPGNREQISTVTIQYPAEILKNNLTIVDTPGVGSLHLNNTEASMAYTEKTDAAIFMLSVDSPLNQIEIEFLKQIRHHSQKIYFVVNKIDLVDDADLKTYLEYCKAQIEKELDLTEVRLFPISARDETDAGVDRLMTAILTDFDQVGAELLAASLTQKFTKIVSAIQSKVEMTRRATLLPAEKFQEADSRLRTALDQVRIMEEEILYRMQFSANKMLKELEHSLQDDYYKNITCLRDSLTVAQKENAHLSPKAFEVQLKNIVENIVSENVNKMRETAATRLKDHFERDIANYADALNHIGNYLYGILSEILAVDYTFEAVPQSLSDKSNFIFHIFEPGGPVFLKPDKLIYLLSKGLANAKLYERILSDGEGALKRAGANVFSESRYRLNESIRNFKSKFTADAKRLEGLIADFMNEIAAARENSAEALQLRLTLLDEMDDGLAKALMV